MLWSESGVRTSAAVPAATTGRAARRWRRREHRLTAVMLAGTCLLVAALVVQMSLRTAHEVTAGDWTGASGAALFGVLVMLLLYGNVAYQLARLGELRRPPPAPPVPGEGADAPLVVLVPSYKEELSVVRQTLLPASLVEHPDRYVVLLIDDPPHPTDPADRLALEQARALPEVLMRLLSGQAARLRDERRRYMSRRKDFSPVREARRLGLLYDGVADWLEEQAVTEPRDTPTDDLFVRLVWEARAEQCRAQAARWQAGPRSSTDVDHAYAELAAMFDGQITSFERKRFVNLSHEPNKAMNLNSYLGLFGGPFRVDIVDGEQHLVRVTDATATLTLPDAEWVLTLDADSLLTHDYATRLLAEMTRPGNERLAVVQTPYSAVPGATTPVERLASATTDVMHLIHQGSTAFGSTYWVGANALLRRSALEDIATCDVERGYTVTRYIQDRTVIEDTESSIDLVDRGWWLYNYPARLAWSATPPDYGALLVQRRRWANGGLTILPKCLRQLWRSRLADGLAAAFLRVHYLVSIAAVNVALALLMVVPLEDDLVSPLLPLSCLPYFVLYARDLKRCGYRYRDLFNVYALNLLLLPVNLGGVMKSVQQAITRQRIPFGRTPKVEDRTAAPRLCVGATLCLLVAWAFGSMVDAIHGRQVHAVAAGVNVVVLAYAVSRFMGWRNAASDLLAGARWMPGKGVATAVPAAGLPYPSDPLVPLAPSDQREAVSATG